MRGKFVLLAVLVVLLVAAFSVTSAQDVVDDVCAALVLDAIQAIEDLCADMEDGTVCYAHPLVEVDPLPNVRLDFGSPGDRVTLNAITGVRTLPVDPAAGEWGIAVIDPFSEADEEEPATYLMLGDVTLNDLSAGADLPPLTAFTVSTGSEEPGCVGAPNKFVIQSDLDVEAVDLTVNGAEIRLDPQTTLVVDAVPGEAMTLMVVDGAAAITALDVTAFIAAGEQVVILLGGDDGLVVIGAPGDPADLDTGVIQFLPIHTFLQTVEIAGAERWTDTGVMLEAGQAYTIIAAELVKTYDDMPWSTPEGHSPQDCAAIGRTDWDCRCRTLPEWGMCTIDEAASMVLVGRVGEDGTPFIVGSGGIFTTAADGPLYLGPNDNTFEDNIGSYYALISVLDLTP